MAAARRIGSLISSLPNGLALVGPSDSMAMLASLSFRSSPLLPGIGGLLHKALQDAIARDYSTAAVPWTWSAARHGFSHGFSSDELEGDFPSRNLFFSSSARR